MPEDGDPRHPVWSVHRLILEHQLLEICNIPNPRLSILDVDAAATDVIRGLAQGWDQKTLCKWLTPPVCEPQQRAVFKALASWIFATQGVLSHIYQPVPSRRAVGDGSILLNLPNELFDKILVCLPCQDVNDVRLTCRESQRKAFDFWSKTFFTKRQFMIDHYSLQTLLDISRHPKLRSVLTHLIIGVEEIDTKDTLSFIHDMHSTNPNRIAAMFRYWRDAAAAQQALLHTGRAIELLSQALSNLTELQAVSVSGSVGFCYVVSSSRICHYPHLGLRSYGAWAYQMQCRHVSDDVPNSEGFADNVFSCVLNSLARASPDKLLTLRTNLGGHGYLVNGDHAIPNLKDEAFYLAPFAPSPTEKKFTFLANITELHLDVNLESRLIRRIPRPADHRHTFDPGNASLRQLLCACHSLVSLSLSAYQTDYYVNHCDFTAWLASTADNPTGTPARWPSLRKLALRDMKVSPATLQKIFAKFDTLRSASLKGISLAECFVDHPYIRRDSEEPLENMWATFFRGSAAVLSGLESLELQHLCFGRWREDPHEVVGWLMDRDDGRAVFVSEAPRAGDDPPCKITVTDFCEEALEALARQTWFFQDWARAVDAAEAAAEGSTSSED